MTSTTLFWIIISIILFDYFLNTLLNYLNSTYWSNVLPEEFIGIYDAEKYAKSQEYEKTNHQFSFFRELFSIVLMLTVLFLNGFALLDNFVRSYSIDPIIMALLFFGIIGFIADIISSPFSVYATFVIEQKFGFNKTTIKTFILDKIKGWFLALILGGGLLTLIVWLYESTGNWFAFLAWATFTFLTIFMSMFYSSLIVPLFNKQKPLEAGELRDAIENFATQLGFKINNIFVIDGSKRSSKANAYFSGFGIKKRIVLYDTLINDHTTDELVAILAHEIGHYKLKHSLSGIILSVCEMGVMLFILSLFISNPILSEAIGVSTPSFHIGLITFGILYGPFSLLLGLSTNVLSRKNEFAADRFAAKQGTGNDLINALKKLSINNLSNLHPHPAYVFFNYSHPPILIRLRAIADYLKKV